VALNPQILLQVNTPGPMSPHLTRTALCLFLAFFVQSAWGSWQYSGTTPDGVAYSATYDLTPGGAYEGTASITGYSGISTNVEIPPAVSFNAIHGGQIVTVNCAVTRIGDNSFQGKASITSIFIPPTVLAIGQHSFDACIELASFTIPSSVTSIGSYAFRGCKGPQNLVLPEGVSYLGQGCFADCAEIEFITIPSTMADMGSLFLSGGIYEGAFRSCPKLKIVSIACGANIGDGAFSDCVMLTTITSHGLASESNPGRIGRDAFRRCIKLSNIAFPDGLASIGQYAFSGCDKIMAVSLPDGISTITNAFGNCSGLVSVNVPASVTNWDGAFNPCRPFAKNNFRNPQKRLVRLFESFDTHESLVPTNFPILTHVRSKNLRRQWIVDVTTRRFGASTRCIYC